MNSRILLLLFLIVVAALGLIPQGYFSGNYKPNLSGWWVSEPVGDHTHSYNLHFLPSKEDQCLFTITSGNGQVFMQTQGRYQVFSEPLILATFSDNFSLLLNPTSKSHLQSIHYSTEHGSYHKGIKFVRP